MPHNVFDPIPDFKTQDISGKVFSSQDLRGRPWLLSFFRFSSCALCNLRIHELIRRYPDYQRKDLEVVAVFESPAENVRAAVGKQSVPFPLIGDPEARLYDLFGVETSEAKVQASMGNPDLKSKIEAAAAIGYPLQKEEGSNFYRMPADFLIGADGRFLAVYYSDVVGDHLPLSTIDAFLLREGQGALQ